MFYVWLGIIILLTIVELLTIELTTIWFVVSGFVSLLLTFVIDNFFIQFLVFVILGILLLISLKSYAITFLEERKRNRILNMKGIVIEEITKKHPGVILIGRKKYPASSNKKIKINQTVEILEIDGTCLKVTESK